MGFIYKITNLITKKCYIGETIQTPEKRWKDHKNAIKRDGGCAALKDAINKYGIDAFKFEVLIICFDEDRLIYEKEYIQKYNSQVPNGYNILSGGQEGALGLKHSDETKRKIGEAAKKRFENIDERKRSSERFKILNKDNCLINKRNNSNKWIQAKKDGRLGKKAAGGNTLSQETKDKIRASVNNYYTINREKHSKIMTKSIGRKITQFSKEGNILATYDSIVLASNATNIKKCTIYAAAAGKCKTAKGFIWKYSDNTELKE